MFIWKIFRRRRVEPTTAGQVVADPTDLPVQAPEVEGDEGELGSGDFFFFYGSPHPGLPAEWIGQ
jgi:hypothetical protein